MPSAPDRPEDLGEYGDRPRARRVPWDAVALATLALVLAAVALIGALFH